ncbi:hypothetical protein [Acuticoccus mangrovi]|uniref:Uncharacterized protein n=1 Tax=Acuticoccus mangrovi TaxID=2796142 RepID=A0A934MHN4_9HYPH|nr:hypothetical protein [Acuticoccus mangrovi]
MSLFMAGQALPGAAECAAAKIAGLAGPTIAAIVGGLTLVRAPEPPMWRCPGRAECSGVGD